jgi:hypothetical protein
MFHLSTGDYIKLTRPSHPDLEFNRIQDLALTTASNHPASDGYRVSSFELTTRKSLIIEEAIWKGN